MTALKIFAAVLAAFIVFSLVGLLLALNAIGGESQIHIDTRIAETK